MGDEFDFEGVSVDGAAAAPPLHESRRQNSGSSDDLSNFTIDNNNNNPKSLLRRTRTARRKYASSETKVKFREPTNDDDNHNFLSFSSSQTSSSSVGTVGTSSSSLSARSMMKSGGDDISEQRPSSSSSSSSQRSRSSSSSSSTVSRRPYGRKRNASSQQSSSRRRLRKKTSRPSRKEWTIGQSQLLNHDGGDDNDDTAFGSQGSSNSSDDGCSNGDASPQITKVVVGRINTMSVQDAGSNRMLFDDVSYLCESILSSPTTTNSAMPYLELTLLLSNAKTRCILWKDPTTTNAILNVLGQAASNHVVVKLTTTPTEDQGKLGMIAQETLPDDDNDDEDDDDEVFSCSQNSKASQNSHASSVVSEEDSQASTQRPIILDHTMLWSLSAMAHYISWDCTLDDDHTATTTSATNQSSAAASSARKVRKKLLEHPTVLNSLSYLILQDDEVRRQRDVTMNTTTTSMVVSLEQQGETCAMIEEEQTPPPALLPSPAASICSGVAASSDDHDVSVDSFGSMGSSSSLSFASSSTAKTTTDKTDPTLAGRRRKRGRRNKQQGRRHGLEEKDKKISSLLLGDESDTLSFGVGTTPPRKKRIRDGQTTLDTARIKKEIQTKLADSCTAEEVVTGTTCGSMMALVALNRIIQGREGEGASCLEHEDDDDDLIGSSQTSMEQDKNDDDEAKNNETDPLVVTNSHMYNSRSLPVLAQSMTETLKSIRSTSSDDEMARRRTYLSKRLSVLSTIIDGSCLLSLRNRRALCEDGFLIGSILISIQDVVVMSSSARKGENDVHLEWLLEMILVSLRTLTSLTHDNNMAGKQIMKAYSLISSGVDNDKSTKGIQTLVDLLQRSANQLQEKHVHFDITVFCLNIITNIIGTDGVKIALLKEVKAIPSASFDDGNVKKRVSFITWLTDWTVAKTITFRDAALSGTFGAGSKSSCSVSDDDDNNNKNSMSQPRTNNEDDILDKETEEHILAAGNGFILLASCMKDNDCVRNMVLERMPPSEESGGRLKLMKNTLKAFCNVYKFSLGALSMAVVSSVKGIIGDLEKWGMTEIDMPSVSLVKS